MSAGGATSSSDLTYANLDRSDLLVEGDGNAWGVSSAATDFDWELASNGTATGETPQNLVPHGVIGDEWRRQKEGGKTGGGSPSPNTPIRDPYHGRTTEPKSIREPPKESFNVMVVGEAGLGKTTLLESFFKSFKDDEAAFALFERKETAPEIETRRQLAEAQTQRNAAERELQAAIEVAEYKTAHAKQEELRGLGEAMAGLADRLKELSLADERKRTELRTLREATRALRLEMKRAADQSAFVLASELQLEAGLLQAECDGVQAELNMMRRGSSAAGGGGGRVDHGGAEGAPSPDYDEYDSDDEDELCGAHDTDDDRRRQRREKRALSSATVCVKAFDPFNISVGKHELAVTLVDTPGYGESLRMEDSFDVITQHVDHLFERQLRAEASWSPRDAERLRLGDPFIHCCLYFIAPHRLKHIDIAFMRALHRYVNIVPIIAKSDTMTTKEKEEFKMFVRDALAREGIEPYHFDTSVIRAMEQQDKQEYKMPWAVIGSTDAYLDAGATVYLRKYPWGDALSSEPAHSDLPALRNLLMWSGQWHDLKMATRAKYEKWRAQRPLSRRSSAAVAGGCRALAARVQRANARLGAGCRAVAAAGRAACESVGVPPKYAGRALLVALLALAAAAGPPVVRWATGTDLSAGRKLHLARQQIEGLVQEKARLVERYERTLAELRGRLHDSQTHGELKGSQERVVRDEKLECQRQLRAASARAELLEARLNATAADCTIWSPLQSAMRTTGAKVSEVASRTTEHVAHGTRVLARETGDAVAYAAREVAPSLLSHGAEKTRNLTRDMGSVARRLLNDFVVKTAEDIHPVG